HRRVAPLPARGRYPPAHAGRGGLSDRPPWHHARRAPQGIRTMPPQDFRASIHPLYAVPLLEAHLPDAARVDRELAELFLALEAEGDRHRDPTPRDTQNGLFESNFYLHQRQEPAVRELFAFIDQALYMLVQSLNGYSDAQMANIEPESQSWSPVRRGSGRQGPRGHRSARWSALRCVDPGGPGPAYSGAVRCHAPRVAATMPRGPGSENMPVPCRLGSWQLTRRP